MSDEETSGRHMEPHCLNSEEEDENDGDDEDDVPGRWKLKGTNAS